MELAFPVLGMIAFAEESRDEVEFIVQEIVYGGSYLAEPITLDPGAVVFDVGANVGIFSRFVHQGLGGDCRIYAFEPIPATYGWLTRNTGDFARLFPVALGAAAGRARFCAFPALPGNSTMRREEKEAELEAFRKASLAGIDILLQPMAELRMLELFRTEEVDCEVCDLSSIVAREGVERIDLLKIDVEGAESEVLDGIDGETWPKIRQVALETHGEPRAEALVERLEGLGFGTVRVFRPEWSQRMGLENLELLAVR